MFLNDLNYQSKKQAGQSTMVMVESSECSFGAIVILHPFQQYFSHIRMKDG